MDYLVQVHPGTQDCMNLYCRDHLGLSKGIPRILGYLVFGILWTSTVGTILGYPGISQVSGDIYYFAVIWNCTVYHIGISSVYIPGYLVFQDCIDLYSWGHLGISISHVSLWSLTIKTLSSSTSLLSIVFSHFFNHARMLVHAVLLDAYRMSAFLSLWNASICPPWQGLILYGWRVSPFSSKQRPWY